jgi:hypothetical protein
LYKIKTKSPSTKPIIQLTFTECAAPVLTLLAATVVVTPVNAVLVGVALAVVVEGPAPGLVTAPVAATAEELDAAPAFLTSPMLEQGALTTLTASDRIDAE